MHLKVFANNADSCELARHKLALLKSALCATYTLNFTSFPIELKWSGPIFNMEESRL